MISNKRLELDTTDKWVWKDSESATFLFKSAYGLLRGEGGKEDSKMYNFFGGLRRFIQLKSQLGG